MPKNNLPRAASLVAIEFASAFQQAAKANAAMRAICWPAPVVLSIPEIGPGCSVGDKDELARAVDTHIAHTSMGGMEQLAFRKRMASYFTALELLATRYAEWRALPGGPDDLEDLDTKAYEREEKAWKALLACAKAHPREIPILAQAVAVHDTLQPWRMREFLKILGKEGQL